MYISKITIKNFRNFKNTSIEFSEGINLLIGANNSGKTNLLKALRLILDSSLKKQLFIEDLNANISIEELKEHSPKISISLEISQAKKEELWGEDLVTVSNWLTTLETPYKAQLHYEFFLPETNENDYHNLIKDVDDIKKIRKIISENFIRLYTYKIWGGKLESQVQADSETLRKFDFQFLDAIRDVERDMFSGKSILLKNIIDFFIDYEIKSNDRLQPEEKQGELQEKRKEFEKLATGVTDNLKTRLEDGKNKILAYANEIGASFDKCTPDFEGNLSENDLYSILQLIIKSNTGIDIPISNNGLGYNNLIFMSLLLSKMQIDSDGKYYGSNAKIFPILCIEEPEAHLHPTMQFQFLKFLKKNIEGKKVRQVFITSHSTHITSSANLDELICLYKKNEEIFVGYPGKVFDQNENSKKYVQRFLDATKSNLLFSEKIILVEGIAEQLLLPVLAEYLEKNFEERHISVINVGGRYFDHFLRLFDFNNKIAINKKIACLTDLDPLRAEDKGKDKKCYPFEYNQELEKYQYKKNDNFKKEKYSENIKFFTQNDKVGKTLEYQLAFENPNNELLLVDSLTNKKEIKEIMKKFTEKKSIEEMLEILSKSGENDRIKEGIQKSNFTEDEKKKSIIAARYLASVTKGENALELASRLKENLCMNTNKKDFNIPEYIVKAIEWLCQD